MVDFAYHYNLEDSKKASKESLLMEYKEYIHKISSELTEQSHKDIVNIYSILIMPLMDKLADLEHKVDVLVCNLNDRDTYTCEQNERS